MSSKRWCNENSLIVEKEYDLSFVLSKKKKKNLSYDMGKKQTEKRIKVKTAYS